MKYTSSTTAVPDVPNVPRHVAIIMDGNGRWATKRFLPRVAGHVKGVEAVPTVVAVPFLFRSRRLARLFPYLGETLLLVCRKAPPIDVDRHLAHWEENAKDGAPGT